jgi:hypothetical protein
MSRFDPQVKATDGVSTAAIKLTMSWDSSYSPTFDEAGKFPRLTVTYSDKFGSSKTFSQIEDIGPVSPLQEGSEIEAAGSLR